MKISLEISSQVINYTLGDLTILCGENATGKSFVLDETYIQLDNVFCIKSTRGTYDSRQLLASINPYFDLGDLTKQRPELLRDFEEMLGGSFDRRDRTVQFYPTEASKKFNGTSDGMYNLFAFWFYLKCVAKPGGIVFIEEPEMGLHPVWQRKMARFLARLINYGVKVFITTHSDYIVKEFNTLIMMRQNEHTRKIAVEEGYREDELLEHTRIRAYDTTMVDGCITLEPMDIDTEQGIWVHSFDVVIDDTNRIIEKLLYI